MKSKLLHYFSKGEILLWCSSVTLILVAFLLFDREGYLSLVSSLVGVTSIIFCAKGNPLGQLLMIIFSLFYGGISFTFAYYGEMITYLGMTAPMAIFALVSWLRNPYKGNHSEVRVSRIRGREVAFLFVLTAAVTVVFYFVLGAVHTTNLLTSTFSVATSFFAAYLTARRSPYFALAYAVNDVVLIILWIMAALKDPSYLSMIVCFVAFLANDLYSFSSWLRMQKRQGE